MQRALEAKPKPHHRMQVVARRRPPAAVLVCTGASAAASSRRDSYVRAVVLPRQLQLHEDTVRRPPHPSENGRRLRRSVRKRSLAKTARFGKRRARGPHPRPVAKKEPSNLPN